MEQTTIIECLAALAHHGVERHGSRLEAAAYEESREYDERMRQEDEESARDAARQREQHEQEIADQREQTMREMQGERSRGYGEVTRVDVSDYEYATIITTAYKGV